MTRRGRTVRIEHATIEATAPLLWEGCALRPDPARVRAALDAGANLELAVHAAIGQRVGPLLARSLAAAGIGEHDAPSMPVLTKDADLRRLQAALLLPHAVKAALTPLMEHGFEPVVFKGPALAMRYADAGLRPMDDIDVLVAPQRHDAAIRVMESTGWEVCPRGPGHHHDTLLRHAEVPHLFVEVHHSLGDWREWSSRLSSGDLWHARVPLNCFGTQAYGVPPEEELVALAAHAGKRFHLFGRMIWSVDLAVVVDTAGAEFDWDRMAACARRTGCTTVVAAGLRHARRLGARVPDDVLVLPASKLRRAALAPLLSTEWPLLDPIAGGHHRLGYALWDARSRRLATGWRQLTEAGVAHVPQRFAAEVGRATRRVFAWRNVDAPDRRPASL